MHHLSQQDLDSKLRREPLARYKRQLAETLQSPNLENERRRVLQDRLRSAGKPRVYRASDPAPPGALNPGPILHQPTETTYSITDLSQEHLQTLPSWGLRGYARAVGVETKGKTKAQIIADLIEFKEQP